MPSRVKQILPSFCKDMFRILDSLNFNSLIEDGSTMKLKIAKRCLIIFCALVTRHRKHTDKYALSFTTLLSSIFSILHTEITFSSKLMLRCSQPDATYCQLCNQNIKTKHPFKCKFYISEFNHLWQRWRLAF
jgi:hypothetical protein